jgi:hypothetical protein
VKATRGGGVQGTHGGGGHNGSTLDIGGAGVVGYGIGVRAASIAGVNSERRDFMNWLASP